MSKNTVVIYITAKRIGLKNGNESLICANPGCNNSVDNTPVAFGKDDFAVSKVSHGLRKLYCEKCAVDLGIITEKEIIRQKKVKKCLSMASS